MKRAAEKIFIAFVFVGIISCGVYQPIEVVPDHVQTIRINPVKNETQQIELSSDLTEEITNEFIREGRLTVVNRNDADSSIDVTVIEYTKIPISYDENFVAQEYKLNMILNLRFFDRVNKVKLWEDIRENLTGGIEAYVKYYAGPDPEFSETEDEARQRLIEDVAKLILQRTIYGWE